MLRSMNTDKLIDLSIKVIDLSIKVIDLLNKAIEWIWKFAKKHRPVNRFRKMSRQIEECRSDVCQTVDQFIKTVHGGFVLDSSERKSMDREQLFNDLNGLRIKTPDFIDSELVPLFLSNMSLYSERGSLREARQYGVDMTDDNHAFPVRTNSWPYYQE